MDIRRPVSATVLCTEKYSKGLHWPVIWIEIGFPDFLYGPVLPNATDKKRQGW